MTAASIPLVGRERVLVARVLVAGAVVGVLDGLYVTGVYAVALRATTPVRLFQSIARALLDQAAMTGGLATAALGLALHFSVALAWSAVWAVCYERSPALRRRVVTTRGAALFGAGYGVLVWLSMNLVVVRLTLATPTPVASWSFFVVLLAHVLVVGPPIALIVRRSAPR